jgi:hypothetical protein
MAEPDSQSRDSVYEAAQRLEQAWKASGSAELADFMPPKGHPLRLQTLVALIQVDQECRWEAVLTRSESDEARHLAGTLHTKVEQGDHGAARRGCGAVWAAVSREARTPAFGGARVVNRLGWKSNSRS